MESMSGQMNTYDIFMASPRTVGKDRRGNFIYRRDNQGKEVLKRDLYHEYINSTIIDFLPPIDTSGRVVDDELPLVANEYCKFKEGLRNEK